MISKKAYSIIFSLLVAISLLAGIALIILSVKDFQNFTFSIICVAILCTCSGAEITLALLQYVSKRKEDKK